jgi:hypothetical protein
VGVGFSVRFAIAVAGPVVIVTELHPSPHELPR